MTEITTEGYPATTTTFDNKNGVVPTPLAKVSKKSVSEDLATTFSSPAAWFLVVALIVTWSAVAIVMFDLMDYKSLVGGFKALSSDPMKVIDEAVEDTSDWIYGFISVLCDILTTTDDDMDEAEIEPHTKKKGVLHPPAKQKDEPHPPSKRKAAPPAKKVKVPKAEEKVKKLKTIKLEKRVQKLKKVEKISKTEEKTKTKLQVKEKAMKHEKPKAETGKKREKKEPAELKSEEVGKRKEQVKVTKEGKPKSKDKDQYQFCRYVIDMYTLGDIYPGHPSALAVTPAPELVKPPEKKLPAKKPTGPVVREKKDAVTATKAKAIKKAEVILKDKVVVPVKPEPAKEMSPPPSPKKAEPVEVLTTKHKTSKVVSVKPAAAVKSEKEKVKIRKPAAAEKEKEKKQKPAVAGKAKLARVKTLAKPAKEKAPAKTTKEKEPAKQEKIEKASTCHMKPLLGSLS
ncbi:triadin [Carcharodon carcharias]|uniref:triadin n=1 Tax=Carcharodon carcharias TaxID=13397 RepID=UPI001B7EFF8A|nr:triadin [Carcharodon carcharias]